METGEGGIRRAQGPRPALTMYSPLSAILRREPLAVPLATPLRQTLESMVRENLDAVVVVDPATRVPLGTFTIRDLVQRVTLPGGDLDQPVACVMTGGLVTMGPSTTAHRAALTMARLGVRHLVVVDGEGRLLGAVSRDDLFGLQRIGVDQVSEQIQAARDLPTLQAAVAGIRELAAGLLAQGTSAETMIHFITTLNDLLAIRVLETTADERALPGVPWCWMALGSEGRLEQTLATSQGNAIVLDADEADGEALRQAFLPFARAVNERLEACGFPRGGGHHLAGLPRWCLTLGEWRRTLSGWLEAPQPETLFHAATVLDFRPVYGQAVLAERLREWVRTSVPGRADFLRQLAMAAVEARPPLGPFGSFVYEASAAHPRSIDLGRSGTDLFSDAARVLGLARGTAHTSTAERLRAVADTGFIGTESVAGLIDAFHFVHLLRLRNQAGAARPQAGPDRVFPRDLNELDRHILKEAFRQARMLQDFVAMEHRLRG